MKCLTVRQPWAWMIIYGGGSYNPFSDTWEILPKVKYGAKNVENRKWKTQYRGPLLIHAAKTEEDEDDDYFRAMKIYWGQTQMRLRRYPDYPEYGSIIGWVNLVDIISNSGSCWAFPDHWHWILENPHPIQPIPYRGMPGLFDVPDSLIPLD